MKKIFILLSFILLFSCEQEGILTNAKAVANAASISQTAVLKFSGTLNPTSGISGSGNVKIVLDGNVLKLKFENYTIDAGPDLKVYLSTTNSPGVFVNLGNANGSTVYTIPQNVDLTVYKYVLIHCQQFNHLFATATLIQN